MRLTDIQNPGRLHRSCEQSRACFIPFAENPVKSPRQFFEKVMISENN